MKRLTPFGRHAALIKIAEAPESSEILSALKRAVSVLHKDKNMTAALTVAIAKHDGSSRSNPQKTQQSNLSASAKRGAEVYKTATCIACHQSDGEGVDKVFPPLNKSEWLSGNRTDAIRIVIKGLTGPIKVLGKYYNGAMPAQENLSDKQIANVLNFARNSWDNKLGDITPKEVTDVRARLKNRELPFTARDFEKSNPKKP